MNIGTRIDDIQANFITLTPDLLENFTSEGAFNQQGLLFDFNFRVGDTNNLEISSFTAAGNQYSPVGGITLDLVQLKRIDNNNPDDGPIAGTRELVWFEQFSLTGNSLNLSTSAVNTMEEALLSNVINYGTDNIFTNQGNSQGNNNNVERVDFVASDGLVTSTPNLDRLGFLILERGGNDAFQIAPITAIDEKGNPTEFGSLIALDSKAWGQSTFDVNAAIARQDPLDDNLRYTFTRESQAISGVFFSYADLGITDSQTFYGYSLFPADINSDNDLVGLSDFPTTTPEAQGGLDLIGSSSVWENPGGGGSPEGEGSNQLKFTLNQAEAGFVNEVGVYIVDDQSGSVDGIVPGEVGYLEAVFNSAQVIFSALSQTTELFGQNPTRIIDGFGEDSQLGYYLVVNSTTDQISTDLEAGIQPTTDVFFSFNNANPNNGEYVSITNLDNDTTQLDWEDTLGGGDGDFNDLSLIVSNVTQTEQPPLGNFLQGGEQRELLDLRSQTQPIEARIALQSNSLFDNTVGLYPVLDELGTVLDPLTGNQIAPGEAGYTAAAIARSQSNGVQFDHSQGNLNAILNGESIYATYLIANGTDTFFPFLEANADGLDYVRLLGDNIFGFEDTLGGGDLDYDDLILAVEF